MNETDRLSRRRSAIRACDRVLSQTRPKSMREHLAALMEHDYYLDEAPDIYGGGIVRQLELRVAELLGRPDAAFFPTGTMAQQVSLRCWAGRTCNQSVGLHPLANPQVHELDSLSIVAGLRTVHLTTALRLPDAREVRDADEPFGTLMLELPLHDAGFVLPTWEELTATVQAARERGAKVHFDGARLWACTTHFGKTLAEIAVLADSVYVSFYKSLNGFSGAAVAGPADFIAEAKAWRHRYGGRVFRQFPAALSALISLDHDLPRLPCYVAHAANVADALHRAFREAVPWYRICPGVPHINEFAVWLPFSVEAVNDAVVRQAEETRISLFRTWVSTDLPDVAKTEIQISASALEWTAEDVVSAARKFISYLRPAGRDTDSRVPSEDASASAALRP